MDESPNVESRPRPRRAVAISSFVVVNFIWWMVMIAAIGLGAFYLNSCPVQRRIPLYLIVLGASSLLSLSLTYTKSSWQEGMVCILCTSCMSILHLFSFVWFISGTVWVYPVYPPNYSPGTARYCHRTVYMFAFIVTTVVWIVSFLMFTCGCCFALLTCGKTVIRGRRLINRHNTFYGATSDSEEPTAGDV